MYHNKIIKTVNNNNRICELFTNYLHTCMHACVCTYIYELCIYECKSCTLAQLYFFTHLGNYAVFEVATKTYCCYAMFSIYGHEEGHLHLFLHNFSRCTLNVNIVHRLSQLLTLGHSWFYTIFPTPLSLLSYKL